MAEVSEVRTCSNPGCDQPGTSSCSACKTTVYCCVTCQTTDWGHHKEECQGHLRKVGMTNLAKAEAFCRQHNWVQSLRYGEFAATKLKQLKDRRLETVQAISDSLGCKFNAFQRLNRDREALECVKECYTMWAMNHLRNPGSIQAALNLIQSCLNNKEFEDAEHYARHAYFMIAEMTDNFIPVDLQPHFLAQGAYYLSLAIHQLAKAGGIPPEEKQKAGEEAITHARKALEIHTQLHGIESDKAAADMCVLAEVMGYFNNVDDDDDEVLRLSQRAIATYRRVEGSSSSNVAVGEAKLGIAYLSIAKRAQAANDLNRCMANLELALPHFRESIRIDMANNYVDRANRNLHALTRVEENIRQIGNAIAAEAASRV